MLSKNPECIDYLRTEGAKCIPELVAGGLNVYYRTIDPHARIVPSVVPTGDPVKVPLSDVRTGLRWQTLEVAGHKYSKFILRDFDSAKRVLADVILRAIHTDNTEGLIIDLTGNVGSSIKGLLTILDIFFSYQK